ncbi:hypothetical protein KIN20_003887 [Parelaphostrongylus tenuis]|uniref:Uncharacterized protein n=1 Tax=Parelaphostrongylus tenuis TaxID=148309 RepID=A0AAD5MIY3_PARTN|nr:hypothetical protein KIN20_003887 [Parelaphostrongylus tenuis]
MVRSRAHGSPSHSSLRARLVCRRDEGEKNLGSRLESTGNAEAQTGSGARQSYRGKRVRGRVHGKRRDAVGQRTAKRTDDGPTDGRTGGRTDTAAPFPYPTDGAGPATMMPRKRKCGEIVGVRTTPRYAILKLQPDTDCVALFQFALSQGICGPIVRKLSVRVFLPSYATPPPALFRTSHHDLSTTSPTSLTSLTSPSTSQNHTAQSPLANGDRNITSTTTGTVPVAENQMTSSRCASAGSSSPSPSMDHFNTMVSTLFGKGEPPKDVRIINEPPPVTSSPPPQIPGPGHIKCRLCGITVSCKKIANLTAHALKIHTHRAVVEMPEKTTANSTMQISPEFARISVLRTLNSKAKFLATTVIPPPYPKHNAISPTAILLSTGRANMRIFFLLRRKNGATRRLRNTVISPPNGIP